MTIMQHPVAPPRPAWEQSENNLLPKWMQYLNTTLAREREDGLRALENNLEWYEQRLDTAIKEHQNYQERAKAHALEIKEIKARQNRQITDEEINERYEAIITSPHVIGTRTGRFGELVILVDPKIPGAEDLELGVYELGFEAFNNDTCAMLRCDAALEHIMNAYSEYSEGEFTFNIAAIRTDVQDADIMTDYNFEKVVDLLVANVKRQLNDWGRHRFHTKADRETRQAELFWSGFTVANPVEAMKRLRRAIDTPDTNTRLALLEGELQNAEYYVRRYVDSIRNLRKEIREAKAEIAKQKAALTDDAVDAESARKSLAYISSLEGVIAIVFRDGIPVLHVRNSVIVNDHRYDLGDFELYLKLEEKHFGTVMKVRRTRTPLGGSYEQGWHSNAGDGGGFCFGNRNDEIVRTFRAGDIGHAVNLAIGTMNSIDEGHVRQADRMFQEIPMETVWTRRVRRRPRRTARVQRALGQKALELIEQ